MPRGRANRDLDERVLCSAIGYFSGIDLGFIGTIVVASGFLRFIFFIDPFGRPLDPVGLFTDCRFPEECYVPRNVPTVGLFNGDRDAWISSNVVELFPARHEVQHAVAVSIPDGCDVGSVVNSGA